MKTLRRDALRLFAASAMTSLFNRNAMAQQPNNVETILCIPGAWVDRSEFIGKVINHEPKGRFLFAGLILADLQEKNHVGLDVHSRDPQMKRAFELAGQGRLSHTLLSAIDAHTTVLYVRLPPNLLQERAKVAKFTQLLQSIGGLAIKVESAGVAHDWERWNTLLAGTPFDVYTAAIALVADTHHFYSCGMHNFSLPDCEVPRALGIEVAAELMNKFNFWRLVESPVLEDRHTFSATITEPRYRVLLVSDSRHEAGDPFFNPHGLWRLHEA
jgi:hypothetical protein